MSLSFPRVTDFFSYFSSLAIITVSFLNLLTVKDLISSWICMAQTSYYNSIAPWVSVFTLEQTYPHGEIRWKSQSKRITPLGAGSSVEVSVWTRPGRETGFTTQPNKNTVNSLLSL